MVQILVNCSTEERERIRSKAQAANMSMSGYLLKQGLSDGRTRDTLDSTSLSRLCEQLYELNQNLATLSQTEATQRAIELCREAGREIVLHRLTREAEQRL